MTLLITIKTYAFYEFSIESHEENVYFGDSNFPDHIYTMNKFPNFLDDSKFFLMPLIT